MGSPVLASAASREPACLPHPNGRPQLLGAQSLGPCSHLDPYTRLWEGCDPRAMQVKVRDQKGRDLDGLRTWPLRGHPSPGLSKPVAAAAPQGGN